MIDIQKLYQKKLNLLLFLVKQDMLSLKKIIENGLISFKRMQKFLNFELEIETLFNIF